MSLTDTETQDHEEKAPPPPLPEPERVLWNRFERFKELLPEIEEDCLKELTKATTEVYPQDVEKLLRAGCSQQLAVKILKPL